MFFWISMPFPAEEKEATWLTVPNGFTVTQFSDDDLATNIYSMTTDRLGRVVVAGPGYIKILVDEDNDGKADSTKLFSTIPRNGAMGMCFDGTDLLCIGDGGLLRFQDKNQDDVADGPPQVLLKLKTGGEHDSHAIRKGPDGWWYLVSGNNSGVGANLVTSDRSPVKNPFAGVITRISPDFQEREIFADGMRNTYDFDFDRRGDLFVYDSDGERDVSLPWYQPTRVFRLHPGSNAGWVTRSWKRPDYFFDIPTVAARLGRGSPTGVVCYRHRQFPKRFHDTLFVLDWTFGRVIAVRKTPGPSAEAKFENELFASGKGTHGFAPTDACVGIDGSLYISVGGRSTQGSVYRISHQQKFKSTEKVEQPENLVDLLELSQPLSAWSRFLWEPAARKMGQQKVEAAIFSKTLSVNQRVRAVEVVVSVFGSISEQPMTKLRKIKPPEIQARLAWATCQKPIQEIKLPVLLHFLKHPDERVRIAAVEALTGNKGIPGHLAEAIRNCLDSPNIHLKRAASSLITASGFALDEHLQDEEKSERIPIALWLGKQSRKTTLNQDSLQFAIDTIEHSSSHSEILMALRLFQISLGDVGPRQGLPQVFESYHPRNSLPSGLTEPVKSIFAKLLVSQDSAIVTETIRCLAMGKLIHGNLLNDILKLVHDHSSPEFDLHVLASIAQSESKPAPNRKKIATIILDIQKKIDEQNLNQDRNWEPRFKEIMRKLVQVDRNLIAEILSIGITRPGQIFLFEFAENSDKENSDKGNAIDRYIKSLQESADFQMNSDTIRLLASTDHAGHWEIIRQSFHSPNVRDTVVEVLARKPVEQDRPKFIAGLGSAQVKTVRVSAQALLRLPGSKHPEEQFALTSAMQRISVDKEGYQAREWIIRVLQKNMGKSLGFVFGTDGYKPQRAVETQWRNHLAKEFPEIAKRQTANNKFNPSRFSNQLMAVPWEKGDTGRGSRLYTTLSCAKCHGKRNRLGPDLAGVSRRFSREDLFRAIVDPGLQVPSRYQTTLFETEQGKLHSGIIIYDSVDGVLLRDSDNQTIRIEKSEITRRQKIARSLMPGNLLQELDSQGYADLYAYLKSL